jgi:hypothetical protein
MNKTSFHEIKVTHYFQECLSIQEDRVDLWLQKWNTQTVRVAWTRVNKM